MRMKLKKKVESKLGDKRIKRQFLFLPKRIGFNFRWFKWVLVEQVFQMKSYYILEVMFSNTYKWVDVAFIDM